MTYADFLILVAILLPYVTVGYGKSVAKDTFDNAEPRKEGGYTGIALRAYNAQLNGFENFPFFAISVLLAEFRNVPQEYINVLAAVYIFIRILYTIMYLKDKPSQRSAFFSVGFLVAVIIFLLPWLVTFLPA